MLKTHNSVIMIVFICIPNNEREREFMNFLHLITIFIYIMVLKLVQDNKKVRYAPNVASFLRLLRYFYL